MKQFIRIRAALLMALGLLPLMALARQHHPAAATPGRTVTYDLYVNDTMVSYTGKRVHAMAINGQIPAPELHFTEGDTAVIRVHNNMHHETSVHWHGLLLPNKEDGVPYLTTAPIRPGTTYTFTFPLKQSGTYWYHSHTMLQEQSGLYGPIVIQPRKITHPVDGEAVLLFSDWTDEKPMSVLTTLRRKDLANEWYAIRKGYPQSLNKLIQHGSWRERVKGGFNRMPPMDMSDVYYDRFLLAGTPRLDLSRFLPGRRIRVRVINGSASSYFYWQYAGGKMQLIAADGIDVTPVMIDRILIGVAETYDFIITIPPKGTFELRATSQDVAGTASAFIGAGDTTLAPDIPRPNVWKMGEMMKEMSVNFPGKMDHGEGGMKMDMPGMDHGKHMPKDTGMRMPMNHEQHMPKDTGMRMPMNHGEHMPKDTGMPMSMDHSQHTPKNTDTGFVQFNYDMLRALTPTAFDPQLSRRKVNLKLTGNMFRYVWSINNKMLSAADVILIRRGEIVQFEIENTTMMGHPMHLHGHFFRVLNKNGDYAPWKHTLDVPPMTTITIEFKADEDKDWFFHCHILYHMMSGMSRIVRYEGSTRDSALLPYPLKRLINEEKSWFFYGSIAAKSHMAELRANYINARNAIRLEANANYNGQYEVDASYERYIGDWFRPYIGFSTVRQEYYNMFTAKQTFEQDFDLPVIGVRYTLPFFIDADLRINAKGRVRFQLEGEQWLLPRLFFNWRINTDKEYHLDMEYLLTRHFSLSGGYDSRYRWGGGLLYRF